MFYIRKVYLSLFLLNIFVVYNFNLSGMITTKTLAEKSETILNRLNNLIDALENFLDPEDFSELTGPNTWGLLEFYLKKYKNENVPEDKEVIKQLVKNLNKFKELIFKKIKKSENLPTDSKKQKIAAIKGFFKLAKNSIKGKSEID